MADMLLDTTVFRDCLRDDPGALAILRQVMDETTKASVSPVTVLELWESPELDRRAEIRYSGILSFLEEAPLTVDAAKTAGMWLASLDSEDDRAVLARCALVAATARERGEPVCTRNADAFARFYPEIVDY